MLQYTFYIVIRTIRMKGKKELVQRKKITREKVSSTRKKVRSLSATELKHFQKILLEKRKELFKNVFQIGDGVLKQSHTDASGDLSSMPIHMADLGSDTFEQEFALGLMDSERKLLREIDNALGRIEDKSYGICLGTGNPISKARLEAQPWAKYSVEFARRLEKGLETEPEEN